MHKETPLNTHSMLSLCWLPGYSGTRAEGKLCREGVGSRTLDMCGVGCVKSETNEHTPLKMYSHLETFVPKTAKYSSI